MKTTFRFGVHPKGNKELSKDMPFELMPVGEKVYIPVSQHIGAPCVPTVNKGDKVKAGTLVASAGGFVSANIFSSVSGEVDGFVLRENVFGQKIRHIVIKNDGLYEEETLSPITEPTKEAVVARVKEAGIVGMGGATFPTHVKLSPKNPIRTLIINGAECEPYITTDYRLMLEKAEGIIKGIRYLKLALNVEEVYIGVEDNKPEAIEAMANAADDDMYIVPLKTKYPQGGEKQLIYAIKHLEVPTGKLPSDVSCVVDNVATAYAVYEAVELGKPSYGRYMTVTGGGIKSPKNLYARNGIPFSEIVEYCGENEDYCKAVSGGAMMGISIANFNCVTTKGTGSLLLLTKKELRDATPSNCINCGSCHRACPMNLMPMMIDSYTQLGMLDTVATFKPFSCMECGCCSYVCPAKRPLVQSMKLAKKLLKEKK